MAIKRILVPTDFSDNARLAFKKACELAQPLGAKLFVLHVHDESTVRIALREGLLREDSTDEALRAEIDRLTERRFAALLAAADTSGLDIEHVSRRGDSDVVIVRYASEIGADLVVVGLRGAGLMDIIRSAVIGSVAESVIRKAPCPVLVVRMDHAAR
jgi:nucleotide-binding universal stress UspA family protein